MLLDTEPRRSQELVLHLIQSLDQAEKRIKSHHFLLARYFEIPVKPRLEWTETGAALEFELRPRFEDEEYCLTGLEFHIDFNALEQTDYYDQPCAVKHLKSSCECDSAGTSPCQHVAACISYLRKNLGNVPVEEAIEWLSSLVSDGREIGKHLLDTVAEVAQESKPSSGNSRLLWRVTVPFSATEYRYRAIRVDAVLQTEKKRGGWTKGRKLKQILNQADESIFTHPRDRVIATLVDLFDEPVNHEMLVREVLLLLIGHPNVELATDNPIPLKIREQKVEIRVEEFDELYRPKIFLGDKPIFTDEDDREVYVMESAEHGALLVLVDSYLGELIFSRMTPQASRLVGEFQRAGRRKASFDNEMAEKLADMMASHATRSLQVTLPEKLAGPEQPLPPAIEFHLRPNPMGEGLLVQLRVSSEGLEDAIVPGEEPDRIRIATPAGRFQLTRDLIQESKNADKIKKQFELEQFDPEGPYSWLIESTDDSLRFIEHLRGIGENAPPIVWPKSKPMRIIGEITPQRLQVQLSSGRDWFGLDGIAKIDGEQIPLLDLLAALRSGSQFIRVGDGDFAAISDQLRDRLNSMFDIAQIDDGILKVSRAATAVVEQALGDDIEFESDANWQDALRRLQETRELKPEPPETLEADLRDYQVAGYQWLARLSHWGIGGCLADDMGLGKTVQTLGVLLDRAADGPSLVIAPTSVGFNWAREVDKFAPSLTAIPYRDNDRQQVVDTAGAGDLVITSYQLLQRDAKRFASRRWHTVVIDEAQFIKNFQTKTAKAVRALDCDWMVALTGTPLENHLGELWSLMRTVSPGLLGTWDHFRKIFAEPIERDRDKSRLASLSRAVQPFILRRTKGEVLTELPPRTEIVHYAELSTAERKKYDAARLAALSELAMPKTGENDQQKRIRVLSWITRLRQLSCHPRLVDRDWSRSSAKLDLLMELIDELRDGEHRALVFSQFVQHLSIVREALDSAGVSYQYLDGSTPAAKRQEAVDAFQRGEGELFLISLKAGGTGLNLTAADYVLHLDPWWNPAVEDQATDRAHRIGQTRPVTVFRLVARDTIEEQILGLHQDKRDLVAGVLDGADKASKLSTNELIDLIQLSQVESV